ncbi:MAG: 23S rRNA (uridine(2552)-2'-O)-methyltransferase RlmE [Candidatus Obscuribacterales bacterium]|nr:23S rRNA (uridine(2552)-2'-O)-methyltransferase RlmE [Steroidobacteraceae bacterium]
MTKRSKSSSRWLQEHETDPYVKAARAAGYRSRAVYKLEEIQRMDRVIRPGSVIVDLGAAPGGWSQYAARVMKGQGRILASDILPMDPLAGVEFVVGDFSAEEVFADLLARLGSDKPALVMSDMAPNMSGIADVDNARGMYLVELSLDFAEKTLAPGGDFLVKVFQGRDYAPFLMRLRTLFGSVKVRKPKASRSRSAELYLLARQFRM